MNLAEALRNPANFLYLVTPIPIARTDRLTRLQKDVWSVVFTRERMNLNADEASRVHLSQKQIARTVGTDRKAVRAALERLVEVGVLRECGRTAGNPKQRGRTLYETIWPEWLGDADALLGSIRSKVAVDEGERGVPHPLGGRRDAPGGGGERPPIDQGDQVEEDGSRGAPPRDPAEEPLEGGGANEPGEEVEEMNLDEESRAAAEKLAAEKAARAERNRRPRRKRVATPADLKLREPSRRPEMNRWREKDPSGRAWSARDVVGYFICRYKEEVREEPREFFATSEAIFRHHGSNVAKYTKRWLEGDYRRARELVEKILARAVDRGMPLKLGYFFTPARESAALRLDEDPKPGRSTPADRNDAVGDYDANREDWDRRAAEFDARLADEEDDGPEAR